MHHMLMLLLLTASPAVIGYTLLLRQQDRKDGFCVTDDDHRTVVFIPDISRRPPPPSAVINAQQPWTSEWQFENMYESKYWSADRMWHDLSQISTYTSDSLSHQVNFDSDGNIYSQKLYVSVLAKSVEISLKLNVSIENNYQNQNYVERNFNLSVDAYNHETNQKELRLKMCIWRNSCRRSDFIIADFLENGTSWVHLEFNIFISAIHGLEINIRKRNQVFHSLFQDNNKIYRSIRLISASFKTNEVAAFFKLHHGHIMSQTRQSEFAVIIGFIELRESRNICLDITWKYNLPSELHLEIKTQHSTIISRSYKSPSFEFDMKTRLSEYLQYIGSYTITLEFKSLGGVSDVSFCSNKKDAIQIFHTNDVLKGCQLLAKADQRDIVIDSDCSKTYSFTPATFPSVLPAICSKIEMEHHLNGFCDNYKVCDHLQCICIHKEASTISPSTANTEPQLSTSIPESADQNYTQDLSKNSSYIGTTSNEALCPSSQQLLTLLMVVLSFLCIVIVILTVMAVQSYRSLKDLEAAEDCTPQNTFEMQPIPGSSTNTG